jgi:gluconolactonase
MTIRLLLVVSLAIAIRMSSVAQTPGSIVRLDPAMDAIVPASANVEVLRDGFGFINGVLWIREGDSSQLLVSDIPANVIHKWSPASGWTVFLIAPTGRGLPTLVRPTSGSARTGLREIRRGGSSTPPKPTAL